MNDYSTFLDSKSFRDESAGFMPDESTYPDGIKDHQRVSVTWACRRARAAIFHATGLGKTLTQITWANQVARHTDAPVIILAPLAVSTQTVREGLRFGLAMTLAEDAADIDGSGARVYITNYEKLHKFDVSLFSGVVLDESSILKGMDGKLRALITRSFRDTPYRLSCTATPSPNDFMELGTQSEFLGIMTQVEMLAMFFIHDGGDTSKWRLKGHGRTKFWEWLATWSIFLRSPADLGFDGSAYDLPPIEYHNYVVETETDGTLFVEPAQSLNDRNRARRDSVRARCEVAANIVNALIDEPAAVWCHLNAESETLAELIDGAVEVRGSDTPEHKARSLLDFADGAIHALVTKPRIAGFGLNLQSSRHCVFVGLSDSWESFYQAIRRQWRFGQTRTVHVHIISADTEGLVIENIRRKDAQHEEMSAAMMAHMRDLTRRNVIGARIEKTDYMPTQPIQFPSWLGSPTC